MGPIISLLVMSLNSSAYIVSGTDQYNKYNPGTYDVCQTEFTMQHYLKSQCFEVDRPVTQSASETLKVRAVLITKDLETASEKQTLIFIPGGPGESSGMLRWVLNKKDMINGMAQHMNINIVMYDPRGTGTSKFEKPVSNYSVEALSTRLMSDDLLAVANAVSPNKPVVLLAHSSGGAIALDMAIRYKDRVAKVILVSASTSPRQMATINLQEAMKKSSVWKRFMKDPNHQDLPLKELNRKYTQIEEVISQQQKARILNKHVHPDFEPITTPMWRDEILVLGEEDPTGKKVAARIDSFYETLSEIKRNNLQALVPNELKTRKLTEKDMVALNFEGEEYIKATVMCGEGLTKKEMNTPIYLDGLTMARFCNNTHAEKSSDLVTVDLKQVKTPVLYLAGSKDIQVPAYIAKEIVSELPNAQLVLEPKAGHTIFYDTPMTFYNSIEKFLAAAE